MRRVFCLLMISLCALTTFSQPKKTTPAPKKAATAPAKDSIPVAPQATKDARFAYYKKVQNEYVNKNLSLPLYKETEKDWIQAFGGIIQVGYRSPLVANRLHYAFADITARSIEFQLALLEVLYTNYTIEFQPEVSQLMEVTSDPKVFALCVEYLLLDDRNQKYKNSYESQLDQRLAKNFNPVYRALKQRLETRKIFPTPPIADLLKFDYMKESAVLFSIQRANRDYPGIMLVRKPDGKFLRNADSSIFYVRQLARSITNLPYYFDDGNTPQGIYRIFTVKAPADLFIGPTDVIRLLLRDDEKIPGFKVSTRDTDMTWRTVSYRSFFPASWQSFEPINEAFNAGMVGRKNIIAHGTTINPEYYAGRSWYPLTPYLGGLTTIEKWDEKTGQRLESDQVKLIDALRKVGNGSGYCVVVEIDDKEKPVEITELETIIQSIGGAK